MAMRATGRTTSKKTLSNYGPIQCDAGSGAAYGDRALCSNNGREGFAASL